MEKLQTDSAKTESSSQERENTQSSSFKILEDANLIKITKRNKDTEGNFLTENGSISHYQNELYWKILKTDSFKKWFEGSVVLYEDNHEPKTVFHSTLKKLFDGLNLKLNTESEGWCNLGIYFSSDRDSTIDYYNNEYKDSLDRFKGLLSQDNDEYNQILSDKNNYLKENEKQVKTFRAFIKIKKPLLLEKHEELVRLWMSGGAKDVLAQYDGIIIRQDSDFSDQFIVFDPKNILLVPSVLK